MEVFTFSGRLFGEKIEIKIFDAETGMAELVANDAYQESLRLQKIFSIYDEESELSKLNRKRGMKCSKELLEVLNRALEMCEKTGGSYDISLGKLFLSRKTEKKDAGPKCTYKDIEIKGRKVRLLHEDVLIDLGSIAKGYIVDRVAEHLMDNGVENGLVDGRGDIRVFGEKEHIAEIQHPRDKDSTVASVKIKDEGIATSGDYRQYRDSHRDPHIINNELFASVTVVAGTAEKADMFATALSTSDEKGIKRLLSSDETLKAVTIDRHLLKKFYNLEAE